MKYVEYQFVHGYKIGIIRFFISFEAWYLHNIHENDFYIFIQGFLIQFSILYSLRNVFYLVGRSINRLLPALICAKASLPPFQSDIKNPLKFQSPLIFLW